MISKEIFAQKLKALRTEKNLTAQQLADEIGVTKGSISQWENAISLPSVDSLYKLADYFNQDIFYLINLINPNTNKNNSASNQSIIPLKKMKLPVLGNIACGKPIYADEELECYVDCIDNIKADFALWAQGDSMIDARINNGDLVFIKKQDTVENGEIAAVLIEDEATLKRVYFDEKNSTLTLMAANSKYAPFTYRGEELNNIKILGKAVAFQSIVQ